jgi:hypothetical protein
MIMTYGVGRLRAAMMQGCHPLSELRNAVEGVAVQRFRARKRTRKAQPQTPRLELNELAVHPRTLAHDSLAASPRHAYKSDILHFQPGARSRSSPAFDVASPTSQGPSCPHKSDHDDRCSTWQRAHRRARQSADTHRLAGALPHSELISRDVGKADADRRVLRIRR